MWSDTQKEWANTGFHTDFVSDPKSWRGPSPIVYKNPGPYKQQGSVGNDGFGGACLLFGVLQTRPFFFVLDDLLIY